MKKLKHVKEKNVTSHKDDIQTYGRIISTDLQPNGIFSKAPSKPSMLVCKHYINAAVNKYNFIHN